MIIIQILILNKINKMLNLDLDNSLKIGQIDQHQHTQKEQEIQWVGLMMIF
jgi:hypothetical protein